MAIGDETEGPFFNIKNNKVLRLPAPEPFQLSRASRDKDDAVWNSIANFRLQAVSRSVDDPIRVQIDSLFASLLAIPEDSLHAILQLFTARRRFDPVPRSARALQLPPAISANLTLFD